MTARAAVLTWAALALVLATTVGLAHVPLGVGNAAVAMTLAATKSALIMLIYMKLWRGRPLEQLAAGTLVLWLAILLSLVFVDYLTRAEILAGIETDLPAPSPRGNEP